MYQITRIIAPSAKLKIPPKSGASLQKRAKMADILLDKFCKATAPEFAKKGYISKGILYKIYKEILPDIDLKLALAEPGSTSQASISPIITHKKNVNTTSGFVINLPFKKIKGEGILTAENSEALFHETSHLLESVTNPKFQVKTMLSGNNLKNSQFNWGFFQTFLYPATGLQLATSSHKEAMELVGQTLPELFNFTKSNSYDKIELLQNFRHKLIGEQKAYPQGHMCAKEISNPNLSQDWKNYFKETAESTAEKRYAYKEKIALMETHLKAELAKVRAEHSQKFKTGE